MEYCDNNKIKPGRLTVVIGLAGFLLGWAGLAAYGLVCLLKKIGWIT